MSGSKASAALPSLTALRNPSASPRRTVPLGSRHRSLAVNPSAALSWGWKTVPPLTTAESRTASWTAEVVIPSAWLESLPTPAGPT
jgi:hypothetical protein